jgi:branched-chain amino acid aminotransferase
MGFLFLNHSIISIESARIGVRDLSLLRGYGIFDYLRTHQGKPLFLTEYLQRFYSSAEKMGLKIPLNISEIPSIIEELLQRNKFEESGIRLVLTGGESNDAFHPGTPNFYILVEPFHHPSQSDYEHGIKVLSKEYGRFMPEIKTTNYLPVVYFRDELKEQNAVDVLYHQGGQVTELSRCNLFYVKNGIVLTNEVGILKGVTRKKVIEIIEKHFPLEITSFTLKDLYEADEVFLTSTTKKVMPITQIDQQKISSGEVGKISRELYEMFWKLCDAHVDQLTTVR